MLNVIFSGIFRSKSKIYDEAFFTSVKPYFKNLILLNSIELLLGSIFYTTHPFVKKTYNCVNFGRKSLVNNGTIVFRNSKSCNGIEPLQKNE